jgi:hypothetical protein
MKSKELWVKERGKDCYSPIDLDTNEVMIGLCIITNEPPGEVFGEYWFEDSEVIINPKGHLL